MTEAKAKYQYMDVARGLALLLVMISHAHGLSSFLIFYYIQIFFIISGYIYKPGRSYGDNIRRKAKRLLVPYFGYSALLWCAYALIRRDMGEMKQSLFGIRGSACTKMQRTQRMSICWILPTERCGI